MTRLVTSPKRFASTAAAGALIALVCCITANAAGAAIYEGPPAGLIYHEGGTSHTQNVHTAEYNNQSWGFFPNKPPISGANTSPSISMVCSGASCIEGEGAYTAAVNASSGTVWFHSWVPSSNWSDSGLGYAPNTSPSVSGLWTAFQAAGSDHLYLANFGSGSRIDTDLQMSPETSPSVTNGHETPYVAFSAAGSDHLLLYIGNGTRIDTGQGIAPGTSPSLVETNGNFYAAFAALGSNDLVIWDISTGTGVNTGLQMASGSSPSIIKWGGYLVAFSAAGSGHLGLYQSGTSGWLDTGQGMQAGSSASLTQRGEGSQAHWDAAFQAAGSHHLLTYSSSAGATDAGEILGEHSSPSISGGVPEE
jgi:hypothetical protein